MITEHILENFKIGCRNVKVNITDIMNDSNGAVKYGCACTFAGRIDIASGYKYQDKDDFGGELLSGQFTEEQMNETYYHELVHIILDDLSIHNVNHAQVHGFGCRLFQYMRQYIPVFKEFVINEYIAAAEREINESIEHTAAHLAEFNSFKPKSDVRHIK